MVIPIVSEQFIDVTLQKLDKFGNLHQAEATPHHLLTVGAYPRAGSNSLRHFVHFVTRFICSMNFLFLS